MIQEPLGLSMPDNYFSAADEEMVTQTTMLEETNSAMQNDSNTEEPILDSNSLEFVSYHNLESDQ